MTTLKRLQLDRRVADGRLCEVEQIRLCVRNVLAGLRADLSERMVRLHMIDALAEQLIQDLERDATFVRAFIHAKRSVSEDAKCPNDSNSSTT